MTAYQRWQAAPTGLYLGGFMDAKEAGQIMQGHRKRLGLTQDQVVERSSVPTPQYLSALENGRYDVRNSEHFKSLVELYGLTADDVRAVAPSAFIAISEQKSAPVAMSQRSSRPIPQGLQDAIDAFGKRYPDLLNPVWQQYLAGFQWRRGIPEDPTAWLDLYRDLDRAGVVPGGE